MLKNFQMPRSGAKHLAKPKPLGRLVSIFTTVVLAASSLLSFQPAVNAAGAACSTTNYLPNTTTYPNNYTFRLIPDGYLLSNNIYYKLNRTSAEAIAVGYDRTFDGALTVPENLNITANEIQAAGFDSATQDCLAFVKTYKVRYIGPDAFSAEYGTTKPVLSAINLEADIKVIGKQAFVAQCRIETLVIPDSVTDIGKTAFGSMNYEGLNNGNCGATDGLKSVTLGVNFKRFYDTAFNQDKQLNSLVLRGEPLSATPGDFPAEYDLWGSNRSSLVGTMDNLCHMNFTYVFNLTVRMLVNRKSDWTPWALAGGCFTQEKINAFTEDVTTPPAQMSAPVASNATQNTADVAFTAPSSNGGSTVTSYRVTSVPGGITATLSGATAGTVTVTGLTAATAYKFNVVAINANGTSSTSSLSNEVTTSSLTVPDITLSSATETGTVGQAIVGYTISNTGGAIASYSISPSAGNGLSFSTSTGLLSGQPAATSAVVRYTITATNTAGTDTATFDLTVIAAPTPPSGGASAPVPSIPIGLAVDPALTTAVISWSTQPGVTEYRLFLDSATIPIATVTGNSTQLSGLKKNTKYTVSLIAVNLNGPSAKAFITFTTDNLVRISIYFAGDRSVIVKSQAARLNSFIANVPNIANAKVSIIGSVKKTAGATVAYDNKLATARAKSVFSRIKASGVNSANAKIKSAPARKSLNSERRAVLEVIYPNS